jgi:predicted neutral ceramidase superfamily lipid hydrolase
VCSFALCFVLLRFLPLLAALFLSVTLIVVLQSLKLTFTSQWMPAMTTDGKPLGEAIRTTNEREKRQVRKTYCLYLVTVYLIIIINAIAAAFTFGSALLLTIPTSYLLLICEQYVNYYTMKGKKYFITYDSIATNPDYGDSEHFFEYIEEMEKEEEAVVSEKVSE